MTTKKQLPTQLTDLIGWTIFSQKGLTDERKFSVDAVGEDDGWYWASATSDDGGTTQEKATSIDGLRAKLRAKK